MTRSIGYKWGCAKDYVREINFS